MNLEDFKQLKVGQSGLIRHDVQVIPEQMPATAAIPALESNLHFAIVTSVDDPLKVEGVLSSTEGISISSDFMRARSYKNLNPKLEKTAGELMNTKVVSIRPDQTLEDLRNMIRETKKKILPVIDGDGRYLGIVTAKDLRDKVLSQVKIRF
jgi:CBS domain-containing protein